MSEFETENAAYSARYLAAREALWSAFRLYQEWQEQDGDWDAFIDWAAEESP